MGGFRCVCPVRSIHLVLKENKRAKAEKEKAKKVQQETRCLGGEAQIGDRGEQNKIKMTNL